MQGVLGLAIELQTFRSPGGLQTSNFSKCWASPPHLAKVGLRHHVLLFPDYDEVKISQTSKAKRGRVWAFLKLQNSTVSGNCPFCPIYSTTGIHHVMKGYWPIIKISIRHGRRLGMELVQPIFSFFWVLGRGGKGEIFSFFY